MGRRSFGSCCSVPFCAPGHGAGAGASSRAAGVTPGHGWWPRDRVSFGTAEMFPARGQQAPGRAQGAARGQKERGESGQRPLRSPGAGPAGAGPEPEDACPALRSHPRQPRGRFLCFCSFCPLFYHQETRKLGCHALSSVQQHSEEQSSGWHREQTPWTWCAAAGVLLGALRLPGGRGSAAAAGLTQRFLRSLSELARALRPAGCEHGTASCARADGAWPRSPGCSERSVPAPCPRGPGVTPRQGQW